MTIESFYHNFKVYYVKSENLIQEKAYLNHINARELRDELTEILTIDEDANMEIEESYGTGSVAVVYWRPMTDKEHNLIALLREKREKEDEEKERAYLKKLKEKYEK